MILQSYSVLVGVVTEPSSHQGFPSKPALPPPPLVVWGGLNFISDCECTQIGLEQDEPHLVHPLCFICLSWCAYMSVWEPWLFCRLPKLVSNEPFSTYLAMKISQILRNTAACLIIQCWDPLITITVSIFLSVLYYGPPINFFLPLIALKCKIEVKHTHNFQRCENAGKIKIIISFFLF